MNGEERFERCANYLRAQLTSDERTRLQRTNGHVTKSLTISRQAGCGALAVAERLADLLQARAPKDAPRWTVFDKNLVEKVLEEHNLPQRLGRFMPENWISEIEDTIDEIFGLHPPSWLLVRKTAETILHLAKLGNVIVIGRGANVITAKMEGVLHVRLVASLESRVQRIQEVDHLDRKAALAFIEREDTGRRRYLRRYYRKKIDDALLYHLIINTDLMPYDRAARLIADCLMEKPAANRTVGGRESLEIAA
jgi:hypothetical protein